MAVLRTYSYYRFSPHLVLDDGNPPAVLRRQDVVEKGSLATSQETSEDSDRNTFVRRTRRDILLSGPSVLHSCSHVFIRVNLSHRSPESEIVLGLGGDARPVLFTIFS